LSEDNQELLWQSEVVLELLEKCFNVFKSVTNSCLKFRNKSYRGSQFSCWICNSSCFNLYSWYFFYTCLE